MAESILVTGGAGFIGSHLAEKLLAAGNRVAILDNFSDFYDPALKRKNAESVARAGGEIVEGDFRDSSAMIKLMNHLQPHTVVHLGACAGVIPSVKDPVLYAETNVLGTTILLDAATRVDTEKFILASSSSVYGNNRKVPFAEADPVTEPISPYAASKRSCELIAHAFSHLHHLAISALRFFTVFGPRQRPDLAINLFMRKIAAGEPITMFGDGSMSRDYTYIDDIISGTMAAISDCGKKKLFRIYNLGGNSPVRLDDLIREIERVVGREAIIIKEPERPGDVKQTYADLTRSREELGFAPQTPLKDGLQQQWLWMQQSGMVESSSVQK